MADWQTFGLNHQPILLLFHPPSDTELCQGVETSIYGVW